MACRRLEETSVAIFLGPKRAREVTVLSGFSGSPADGWEVGQPSLHCALALRGSPGIPST